MNSEAVERCCFCDEPFAEGVNAPAARAAAAGSAAPSSLSGPTEGNLAVQPANWRHELAGRVHAYRERRRRLLPDDVQADLPFNMVIEEEEQEAGDEIAAPPQNRALLESDGAGPFRYTSIAHPGGGAHGVERVDIAVSQPQLEFNAPETHPRAAMPGADQVIPVASLRSRQIAGMLDSFFLALACGAFLGLFRVFGGQLVLGKLDAAVSAAALALLYAQYFALFTIFGGETPGMTLRGLRVVSFDGTDPTPRQLLWRSFGYFVSGGTALLGFLWAFWDEDHLTWQDRISQTYLTDAPAAEAPVEQEESFDPSDRPGVHWRRRTS